MLSENQIIDEIKKQEFPTSASVSRALGQNKAIIWAIIQNLCQRGKVRKCAVGRVSILRVVRA